jgi:hypothetical protein
MSAWDSVSFDKDWARNVTVQGSLCESFGVERRNPHAQNLLREDALQLAILPVAVFLTEQTISLKMLIPLLAIR